MLHQQFVVMIVNDVNLNVEVYIQCSTFIMLCLGVHGNRLCNK